MGVFNPTFSKFAIGLVPLFHVISIARSRGLLEGFDSKVYKKTSPQNYDLGVVIDITKLRSIGEKYVIVRSEEAENR